jgi:hypothetical protein
MPPLSVCRRPADEWCPDIRAVTDHPAQGYSTPPPASYSSGMTPVRTRTSGGPQSPRSGSPVRDQASTPTESAQDAQPMRGRNRRTDSLRLNGYDAAASLLVRLHDVKGVGGHTVAGPLAQRRTRSLGSNTEITAARALGPVDSWGIHTGFDL